VEKRFNWRKLKAAFVDGWGFEKISLKRFSVIDHHSFREAWT